MQDHKKIVKNSLLLNKITEYFAKNPQRNSVVVKAAIDGNKVFWRAVREGASKFRITEVNTSTNSFLFEIDSDKKGSASSPNGAMPIDKLPKKSLSEASPAYGQISKMVVDAIASPDPSAVSKAIKQISALSAKITDKHEAEQVAAILDYLGDEERKTSRHASFSNALKTGTPAKPAEAKKITEASQQFGQASREFVAAMTPPLDHNKLSLALKKINGLVGQITDPFEREQIGGLMGILTQAVDSTTAGGGSKFDTGTAAKKPGAPVTSGKAVPGASVSEAGDEPAKKKDRKQPDDSEEAGLDSENPGKSPDDATDVRDTKPPVDPEHEQDPAQKVFSQRLAGQTIRNATVKLKPDGGELDIELVGSKIPAKLSWENSGKVSFVFKNRPYALRR